LGLSLANIRFVNFPKNAKKIDKNTKNIKYLLNSKLLENFEKYRNENKS